MMGVRASATRGFFGFGRCRRAQHRGLVDLGQLGREALRDERDAAGDAQELAERLGVLAKGGVHDLRELPERLELVLVRPLLQRVDERRQHDGREGHRARGRGLSARRVEQGTPHL